MKTISIALAIVAFASAGAAVACEDHAMGHDSMAFAPPNASQKPVAVAGDSRGGATADKPAVAVRKVATKPDTAGTPAKPAAIRVASKCTGTDC